MEVVDDASEWVFRAEGNANVVLAYVGDDTRFRGRVLRLRKRSKAALKVTNDPEQLVSFWKDLVGSLIGEAYLSDPTVAKVSLSFLSDLSTRITRERHGDNDVLDYSQTSAVLLRDATTVAGADRKSGTTPYPCISFEMKPKWGCLPSEKAVVQSAKRYTCRYCMHRRYKEAVKRKYSECEAVSMICPNLNMTCGSTANGNGGAVCRKAVDGDSPDGSTAALSNGNDQPKLAYCPLDLFSGVPGRVRSAVQALYQKEGNKMKVYLDSAKVPQPQIGETMEQSWIKFGGDPSNSCGENRVLLEVLSAICYRDPILKRLKALQRQFDPFDIEGIHPKYQRLAEIEDLNMPDLEGWKRAIRAEKQYASENGDEDLKNGENWLDDGTERAEDGDDLLLIYRFLFATMLKDCSLIVTITCASENEQMGRICGIYPQSDGKGIFVLPADPSVASSALWNDTSMIGSIVLSYRIFVVDTDPKPIRKIPDYYRLDQEIVRNYIQTGECKRCNE